MTTYLSPANIEQLSKVSPDMVETALRCARANPELFRVTIRDWMADSLPLLSNMTRQYFIHNANKDPRKAEAAVAGLQLSGHIVLQAMAGGAVTRDEVLRNQRAQLMGKGLFESNREHNPEALEGIFEPATTAVLRDIVHESAQHTCAIGLIVSLSSDPMVYSTFREH